MVTRRDMISLAVAGLAGTALESSGAITRSALALRGAMMGGRKKLPYDAEVEYLETHRKSWIDTGLLPKQGCTFYLDYYIPNNYYTYGQIIFGTFIPRAGNEYEYRYGHDWVNAAPAYAGVVSALGGNKPAGRYFVKMSKEGVFVNGVLEKTYDGGTKDATATLLLGTAHNYNWYGDRTFYGQIFSFGYDDENGNEVMRLIPVRVGDVGKFYDRISGRFFESQDEPFIIGPDKV